jgi:hypothetical protein
MCLISVERCFLREHDCLQKCSSGVEARWNAKTPRADVVPQAISHGIRAGGTAGSDKRFSIPTSSPWRITRMAAECEREMHLS